MPVLIPYQTAAETVDITFLRGSVPASLILDVAAGWAGAETIPCHYVGADGIRITPVLDSDGVAFELSATRKVLPVHFPCKIRLVKGVTAAAVGVNSFSN